MRPAKVGNITHCPKPHQPCLSLVVWIDKLLTATLLRDLLSYLTFATFKNIAMPGRQLKSVDVWFTAEGEVPRMQAIDCRAGWLNAGKDGE